MMTMMTVGNDIDDDACRVDDDDDDDDEEEEEEYDYDYNYA